MPKLSIYSGIVLICVGLLGYFGVKPHSPTALIPTVIGLILIIAGIRALNEKNLKQAMHIAAIMTLLGLIGSLMRLIPSVVVGNITAAFPFLFITFVVCLIFLIFAVRSFIEARKARENKKAGA
jgi:uncharacterized membrane protein